MNRHSREEWFQAYVAAMLEGDESRVQERVSDAWRAIESRLAGIGRGEAASDRELVDLRYASRQLQLLSAIPSA